jgi:hypothetical protein
MTVHVGRKGGMTWRAGWQELFRVVPEILERAFGKFPKKIFEKIFGAEKILGKNSEGDSQVFFQMIHEAHKIFY